MKIVLCIKQVPDTSDIKWTENNTINREGVESVLNPLDLYATEAALKIKDSLKNVEISVVTMGPLQAEDILKKAIALGCDKAFLLSDKKFAGADTYATAKTLSKFISKFIPDFDMVICGQFASDGDTAQTGPSLAKQLNIPVLTYVKNLDVFDDKFIVERETELNIEKYEVGSPVLLAVSQGDFEPRRAKIDGYIKVQNTEIKVLSCSDINMDENEAGIKGSPTYVARAFTPKIEHEGQIYINENVDEKLNILVSKIREYV